jgi:acetyl-CoA hydrolase
MQVLPLARLDFASLLEPGDVIAWPQGPGEPLALTEALVAQGPRLRDLALMFGMTNSETLQPALAQLFRLLALNGAGNSRRVTAQAQIHLAHLSAMPRLLREKALRVDVALIQVRPLPDGGYTLGVICDFTLAMMQSARCVVALLNPALPLMGADARVDAGDIDLLVESDSRLIDMADPEPSAIERQVARQVAALIPDRATLQLGIGTLPAAVAQALDGHRDLGMHSGVVSDGLVDLVQRGIVTNAFKGRDAGKTVTGGLFGTQRLRDFAEHSGLVEMRSAAYTHPLSVTGSLAQFHTVNSAIEVDLTGAANAEVAGGRYLGAVGGLVDFVRAGQASYGGRSILAFPSTTPDGKQSRIVAGLQGPVTVARSEVDLVVTEQGVADLRACPVAERVRRLIAIAHPSHREALERSIRERPPV